MPIISFDIPVLFLTFFAAFPNLNLLLEKSLFLFTIEKSKIEFCAFCSLEKSADSTEKEAASARREEREENICILQRFCRVH